MLNIKYKVLLILHITSVLDKYASGQHGAMSGPMTHVSERYWAEQHASGLMPRHNLISHLCAANSYLTY